MYDLPGGACTSGQSRCGGPPPDASAALIRLGPSLGPTGRRCPFSPECVRKTSFYEHGRHRPARIRPRRPLEWRLTVGRCSAGGPGQAVWVRRARCGRGEQGGAGWGGRQCLPVRAGRAPGRTRPPWPPSVGAERAPRGVARRLDFETSDPTDDIRVTFSDGRRAYVSAKRKIDRGRPLEETLTGWVGQVPTLGPDDLLVIAGEARFGPLKNLDRALRRTARACAWRPLTSP